MNLADRARLDVNTVFLPVWGEDVTYNGNTYKAIVTVTNTDEQIGNNMRNVAKIAMAYRLPYGSTIVHGGISWRVQTSFENMGLFEHVCYETERVSYGG